MHHIALAAGMWLGREEGGWEVRCSWLLRVAFVGGMEEVLTGATRIVLGGSKSYPVLSRRFPSLFVLLFYRCVHTIGLSTFVRNFMLKVHKNQEDNT